MKKHLQSPPSCAFFAFVVNFFRCFSRKGLEREGFEVEIPAEVVARIEVRI
ncbi:MAG: hypothetical protein LBH51_07260 [Treponema sp.]|jgi:hypothetical protein|nr:hypothetical protein [Treponema sp.]